MDNSRLDFDNSTSIESVAGLAALFLVVRYIRMVLKVLQLLADMRSKADRKKDHDNQKNRNRTGYHLGSAQIQSLCIIPAMRPDRTVSY